MLGICYGHQLLAKHFGGIVERGTKSEYGLAALNVRQSKGVLNGMKPNETVWISHADLVESLPDDFEILASTPNCRIAAYQNRSGTVFGVQFHPEVQHTPNGMKVLKNFAFDICHCTPSDSGTDFIAESVRRIQQTVGGEKAVIALSGGVDSSVAALLSHRAIGNQLTAIFVDHGFMRLGEGEQVREMFQPFGLDVLVVDAKERFLKKLDGVRDPEQKRKIVGTEFIRVFEESAQRVGARYLIQGTIYSDRIESGATKNASVIKSHHNVGGMPSNTLFHGVIEPLKELYKDEVRAVGKQLNLPPSIVQREVFPGPGAVVRICGAITEEKRRVWQRVDQIVREEFQRQPFYSQLWMAFPILTDTLSTGVKGDARAFGSTIAIRCIESRDAMTANFSKLPWDFLERLSTRITNEVPEATRVVYDITNKPPATMEWE